MRKFYQSSWHGIEFNSFTKVSSRSFADTNFYNKFYDAFFRKYKNVTDLDPAWLRLKNSCIETVHQEIFHSKKSSILSLGCGLGIMEIKLLDLGYSGIEINEISKTPLKWVSERLPSSSTHIGQFPDCIESKKKYDTILLSSVDYFLDEQELHDLLKNVVQRLNHHGTCVLFSWSFESNDRIRQFRLKIRALALFLLEKLKIKHRGQLWGYIRTVNEYRNTFARAGFKNIRERIIDTGTPWLTYLITGTKIQS